MSHLLGSITALIQDPTGMGPKTIPDTRTRPGTRPTP